jgi:hypothetical protein
LKPDRLSWSLRKLSQFRPGAASGFQDSLPARSLAKFY